MITMGIELETMAYPARIAGKSPWGSHYDGSLEDSYGRDDELVSPILEIDSYQDIVNATLHLPVTLGNRYFHNCCGLHIHVGVESMTYEAVNRLLRWWYSGGERAVWALVKPWQSRKGYCSMVSTMSLRDWSLERYCSLNLQAVDKHGTIEFRLFNAGHTGWVRACMELVWVLCSAAQRNMLPPLNETRSMGAFERALDDLDLRPQAWATLRKGVYPTRQFYARVPNRGFCSAHYWDRCYGRMLCRFGHDCDDICPPL